MNTERVSEPEVVTTVAALRERLAAVRRGGQRNWPGAYDGRPARGPSEPGPDCPG